MWKKLLVIVLLFYVFALLQNSFFTHFNFFGTLPNLIFILFFTLAFFNNSSQTFLFAIIAGFFLDIYAYTYICPSIILLLIIGFLLKKVQTLLIENNGKYPFGYFLILFLIFLTSYSWLIDFVFDFLNIKLLLTLTYNSFIALLFFYIYRRFINEKI